MPTKSPRSAGRFVGRLLGWLIAAPLLILFILFAVSNRQDIMLELWPLPASVTLPLSLLLLGLLFGTLLLGLCLGWLGQHGVRAENRQNKREIARLRGMLAAPATLQTDTKTTTLVTAHTVAQTIRGDTVI